MLRVAAYNEPEDARQTILLRRRSRERFTEAEKTAEPYQGRGGWNQIFAWLSEDFICGQDELTLIEI